jgi:glycine oxidase
LTTSTSQADVAVVGGGIVGLAAAWHAARAGLRCVVLERDAVGAGASHAAAGMLAPVAEADPREPAVFDLGRRAAARWPGWADELAEATGGEGPGYLACGTLMVARDRDEAEALEREAALRAGLGVAVERLRASQARRREPALAPTVRLALDLPDDHAVDPRRAVAALHAAARRAGVEVREGAEVARVRLEGERATGVELASGEDVPAGQVLVAAGSWSGAELGLPPPARVPVRPVKGQILRLRDPHGPGLLRRVLRYEGGYLVPRGDGRYVLGATVEERGFDTAVTALGVYELLRDAAELVPGVLELELDEAGAGLRPGTPDNLPVVGPAPGVEGLVWATGHYRHGVLLAPLTADLAVAALRGEPVPAAVSPARFAPVGVAA